MTLSRRTLIAVSLGVAVSLFALTACTPDSPAADSAAPTSLKIAAAADLVSFDPAELQGGQQNHFWQPVYETLIRRDSDGTLSPNVASEWGFSDPLTFDLTLTPELEYADGSPITATSVIAGLERFKAGTGPDAQYLQIVSKIEAVDDSSIVFHLAAPDPGLPYKLSSTAGAVANPAQFDSPDVQSVPGSSGAYVLDEAGSSPGSSYHYVRNENYWNPEAYPYDDVTVVVLEDLTARVNALRSGQVDVAVLDGPSAKEVTANGFEITKQSAAWEGIWLFDRTGEKNPALGDARVRQAMNKALDRDSIVENLMLGYGVPTDQIFKPGTDGYLEDADAYSFDPDEARALMEEAGYADGFDLTMPHSAAFEYLEPTIADQLGAIGIRVTWDNIPAAQYLPAILQGDYAAAMFRYTQDSTWVDITRHITADAVMNPLHTTNDELSALLDTAQTADGEADVTAAYQAVSEYVYDEAWFLPVNLNVQVVAHSSDIAIKTQVGQSVIPIYNYSPAK